jgi:hypothetical protein
MLLIGLVIALIAFGFGDVRGQQSSPTGSGKATLTVMGMSPLGVSGRGFQPGERVVVSTGAARRSVTANAAGRFVVRFPALRCAGAPIRAVGSKGSRAVTRPPKVLCVEP